MKFFSKKWRVVLIVSAVIAASGLALNHFVGFDPISVGVNTITAPIKNGFSYISGALLNARNFIWEMRAYKADNERLAEENIRLKREARDIASYREENEQLKTILDLQTSFEGYSMVAARVISYSSNNWFDELEINKGSINGISEGNAVVTSNGIVGKVTETGPNYAIVKTILDSSSAVGIRVNRTGGNGLVEGDSELSRDLMCKLSFLDRGTPILVGDIVETSGTGGIYPPGLAVGTIMTISADSTGSLKSAVVNPAVDFDNLQIVSVINGVY